MLGGGFPKLLFRLLALESDAPVSFVGCEGLPYLWSVGASCCLYVVSPSLFLIWRWLRGCWSPAEAVIQANSPWVSSSFSPWVPEQKVSDCDVASGARCRCGAAGAPLWCLPARHRFPRALAPLEGAEPITQPLSPKQRGRGCGLSTNRPVPKPLGGWDCRLGVSPAGRAAAGPGSRGSREPTHTMGLSASEWGEPAPSETVFTRTQLVIGPVSQWPLLTRSACIPVGCPPPPHPRHVFRFPGAWIGFPAQERRHPTFSSAGGTKECQTPSL